MNFFKEIQKPVNEGPLDDVRARMDARRNPPEKQSANPNTPLPPVPPYVAPTAPAELKAGDIIGYRPKNAKMVPTKAKVLKLLSGGRVMVSVSSPRLIAQNNGSPVITIGPLDSLDIQNPYKEISTGSRISDTIGSANNNMVMKEAAEDWLPAYNSLVKNDGEPSSGGSSGNLNWKKMMALSAKDNGITGFQELANFVKQYALNGQHFNDSRFTAQWQQLTDEINALVKQAPTMDEMRKAVQQQAAGVHQQNLTNIQNQLDLENAPLQHEMSVQALINKAELDQADQKELLELDMEARLAIIKIKQDLELDAKERLTQIEREIEDRKEREDIRKHELEMAQAGYKHEIAVINATAEGEYRKAKLEADYQVHIKQLDNIDNAGERQNRLDQINTEKAKQLAIIDSETKARVEVMQKEVDVERQQSDIKINQAFMMAFNPIWGAALTAAHAAGSTWKAGINNLNKALAMLSKPIMPTAQKEGVGEATRPDAYQRDEINATSGFGKNSYAYQQDGGANDEDHEGDRRREQQVQSGTWYVRINGKIVKDKAGNAYTFRGKAAANKAALTMQAKPFNQGKEFMLTTNPNDKVVEADAGQPSMYYSEELAHKVFDLNPNLDATGKADAVLDAGWPIAVADLGKKSAQYKFAYDEDFPSDFVSAYAWLQKNQGVTESTLRESDSPVAGAITRRIMLQRHDLLSKYGPVLVTQAIDEVADFVGDVEEIGSSDVSGWIKQVEQMLANNPPEAFGKGVNEDTLSQMRDYFNQPDDSVSVTQDYGNPVRKKPTAGIPPHIQALVNKMYTSRKITPEEFKVLQDFQKKTKINVGIKEADTSTGNAGYDNMLAVMKAADAGQDATFNLGGEPVTLDYNEARFLAGRYKAFLKAGRQEEFLKYMESPVSFDRLMKQLRDLMDKQKNFKGSVEGERSVEEAAPGFVSGAAGLALGAVAAAGAPAIVSILGPLLGIPMAAYGAYSAAKLGMKGVEKLWDMASEKLGGDDKVEQYTQSKIAGLPPEEAKAAAAVVGKISESRKSITALPQVNENEYWCQIDSMAKPIPEGYKRTANGYITRN